jgi:uncharacterized membrane protein
MKPKLFALFLLSVSLVSVQAQVFRPEIVNGAALGAIAGAVIGNNSGDLRHDAWTGAALGAGAGALLGAVTAQASDNARYDNTRVPAPYDARRRSDLTGGSRAVPGALVGGLAGAIIGNNSRGHNGARGAAIGAASGLLLGSIADANAVRSTPVYDSVYSSDVPHSAPAAYVSGGNRAVQGALIGGLAGAIIGNNSRGHNGARGAVIGATTGLVLGSMAGDHGYGRPVYGRPGGSYRVGIGYGYGHGRGWDHRYRGGFYPRAYGSIYWEPEPVVIERPVTVVQPAPAYTPAPAPQQITIINNYYGSDATAMSSANSLFGR